ncbi:MAG: hypothetical protein C4325_13045 [Blastocatellia bacterium]
MNLNVKFRRDRGDWPHEKRYHICRGRNKTFLRKNDRFGYLFGEMNNFYCRIGMICHKFAIYI